MEQSRNSNVTADELIRELELAIPLMEVSTGELIRDKIETYRARQNIERIKQKYQYDDWYDMLDILNTNSDFARMYANRIAYINISDWNNDVYCAFMSANNYRRILDDAMGIIIKAITTDVQAALGNVPYKCTTAIQMYKDFLKEFEFTAHTDFRADSDSLTNLYKQQELWKEVAKDAEQLKTVPEMVEELSENKRFV